MLMLTVQRQGKTSFYMQHLGQEAVSTAFRRALEPGDMNSPNYREAGLLIAGWKSLQQVSARFTQVLAGSAIRGCAAALSGAWLTHPLIPLSKQSAERVGLGDGFGERRH